MSDRRSTACPKAILQALVSHMRAGGQMPRGTMVLPEMVVDNWARRVDLALIGRDFHAVEIKGERDTLDRLGGQLEAMRRLFNRVTICVASRHLCRLAGFDMDGLGLIEARDCDGHIEFHTLQHASHCEVSDRRGLVHFMTRSDIETTLRNAGVVIPPRTFIYPLREMAEKLPLQALQEAAIGSLRRRFLRKSSNARRRLAAFQPLGTSLLQAS